MSRRPYLLVDVALFGLATIFAFGLRHGSAIDPFVRPDGVLYLAFSVLLAAILFSAFSVSRRVWRYFSFIDVVRIGCVTGLAACLAFSAAFLVDRAEAVPRTVPVIQWLLSFFLLTVARGIVRVVFDTGQKKEGRHTPDRVQNILVVGVSDVAELYIRCVERLGRGAVSVAGILDEQSHHSGRVLKSARILGSPANVQDIANQLAIHGVNIDRIVIAVPFDELSEQAVAALRRYEKLTGQSLDVFQERLGFPEPAPFGPVPEASLQAGMTGSVRQPAGFYLGAKRTMDFVLALTLLIGLSPVALLVYIATLLDIGTPATFWQVRPGLNGRTIRVLKFRTMRGAHDVDGNRIPDAERTTRLGAALRRSRLDELPQLVNILIGDMSFIGPRPLLPVDQPASAAVRLSVRPGLTGWAQINGGRALSKTDKAALDAWYVNNLSFGLDLEIAFKTVVFLIVGESVSRPSRERPGERRSDHAMSR